MRLKHFLLHVTFSFCFSIKIPAEEPLGRQIRPCSLRKFARAIPLVRRATLREPSLSTARPSPWTRIITSSTQTGDTFRCFLLPVQELKFCILNLAHFNIFILSFRSAAYIKMGQFNKAYHDAVKAKELNSEWPKVREIFIAVIWDSIYELN